MLHTALRYRAAQPSDDAGGQPPPEPPAGADHALETPPAALRVGDYEVGDGFCPHLYGHPNIRY